MNRGFSGAIMSTDKIEQEEQRSQIGRQGEGDKEMVK